ncbi:MAG: hypothetical protein ACR2ID_10565 [Chthoniobacterales bacterium]
MKPVLLIVLFALVYPTTAWSQEAVMAMLEGEDGYQLSGFTECDCEADEADAKATSIIQPGERFIARGSDGKKDWGVYLKSGIRGTIPRNRIRILPGEPLAKLNFAICKKKWRKLQSQRIKKTDPVAYSAKKYHGVANVSATWMERPAKGMKRLLGYFFMSPAMTLSPSCSPGSLPGFGKDTRHF